MSRGWSASGVILGVLAATATAGAQSTPSVRPIEIDATWVFDESGKGLEAHWSMHAHYRVTGNCNGNGLADPKAVRDGQNFCFRLEYVSGGLDKTDFVRNGKPAQLEYVPPKPSAVIAKYDQPASIELSLYPEPRLIIKALPGIKGTYGPFHQPISGATSTPNTQLKLTFDEVRKLEKLDKSYVAFEEAHPGQSAKVVFAARASEHP